MTPMFARDFPPIEEFVPHRCGMLLLDAIVAADDEAIEAALDVLVDGWYSGDSNGMPAWFGIELMAQTVAAHVTHLSRTRGLPPKHGVLLGTRRYRSAVPVFECGTKLRIKARESFRDADGFAAYDCEIADCTRVLASASIKAYQPEDFRQFLQAASA